MLRNCRQAAALAALVDAAPDLERLAPVALNIVCFRYRGQGVPEAALDALNKELVVATQESGIAVPSTTIVDGRLAIRVNLTNHRTTMADLERLLAFVRERGAALTDPFARTRSPLG
jgi:glutamate/tyrosine decarboxylase-like PLP-dependent enzyme